MEREGEGEVSALFATWLKSRTKHFFSSLGKKGKVKVVSLLLPWPVQAKPDGKGRKAFHFLISLLSLFSAAHAHRIKIPFPPFFLLPSRSEKRKRKMDLAHVPTKSAELISLNFFYIFGERNGNDERRDVSREDFRIDLLLISSDARDWIMPRMRKIEFFSAWNFFLEIYGAWKCRRRRRLKKIHQMKREIFMCGRFSPFPLLLFLPELSSLSDKQIFARGENPPKMLLLLLLTFLLSGKRGRRGHTFPQKMHFKKSFAKWSRCCIEMSGRNFNLACQRQAAKKSCECEIGAFLRENSRASVVGTQDALLRLNCIHMYGKGRKLRKKEKIKLMEANEAKERGISLVAQLFFCAIFDFWRMGSRSECTVLPFSSALTMMPTRSFSWPIHWIHHSSVFSSLPEGRLFEWAKRDMCSLFPFPLCAAFSLLYVQCILHECFVRKRREETFSIHARI